MEPPRSRHALMLINQNSRRGAETDLHPFMEILGAAGIAVHLHALKQGESPADAVLKRSGNADLIIIGGGDGTISGAAPALVQLDRPVALLPLGTANDLARELGIPEDVPAAAKIIVEGKICRIDVGRANDQWFFNAAGIGLGPAMTADMNGVEKARWGVLAYARAVLRRLRDRRAFRARIYCKAGRLKLRALQLTVANGKYYGGGMTTMETARVDDGTLNLIAIKPVSILELLRVGVKLRTGRVNGDPKLVAECSKRILIETRKPMPVTTDGEITTQTPVDFSVRESAIGVYVPKDKPQFSPP